MRKQDKRRPKKRGVWLQVYDNGDIGWLPIRMTRTQAIAAMQKSLSRLQSVEGMTKH